MFLLLGFFHKDLREELRQKARREHEHIAVFPCKLRVLPQHVFNARNPIVCGVSVEAGQLKKGAPICVPSKEVKPVQQKSFTIHCKILKKNMALS